jgi:hypothetical protein
MLKNLPLYIYITFFIASLGTVLFLLYAVKKVSVKAAGIVGVFFTAWMFLQEQLSTRGFYLKTDTMPPRFMFAVVPMFLLIAALMILPMTRNFLAQLPLLPLTLLHIVRVPVELSLHWLYQEGLVPQLMTFEGRNFDIISGLTAPLIVWLAFKSGKFERKLLLGWNIVCLLLLINIVTHAILSLPYPMQKLAFDQPNRAVLYFPFIWLPSVIVTTVLFCHVVSIWRLINMKNDSEEKDHR